MAEKEKAWTHHCKITFNSLKIERLTITDHYIKSGHDKHGITNKLIRELMDKLNEIPIMKPKKKHGNRDIYVWEKIHEDFGKKNFYHKKSYQRLWKKENLTYQDAQERILAGFKPDDY